MKLPVTTSVVKSSGMGKAVGTIEKHSICKGTPNEAAIRDRVQQIKDAWKASVKALKASDVNSDYSSNKRPAQDSADAISAKRVKPADEPKKSGTFSSLLQKVSKPGQQHPKTSSQSSEATGQKGTDSLLSASDYSLDDLTLDFFLIIKLLKKLLQSVSNGPITLVES